jgi:hypothetical protein
MKPLHCLLWTILLGFLPSFLDAQNYILTSNGETIPTVHLNRGDSLFRLGQVKPAIREYRLQNKEKHSICKYELACAYARDGQVDSSFHYLFLNLQYDTSRYALINPDFLAMRNDPRWNRFEDQWLDSMLMKRPGSIKDIPLAKLLWKMYARDQAYYYELRILHPRYADSSAITQTFWNLKRELNNENLRLLDSIIAVKGWPKVSQVGSTASAAAFLVIQHAELKVQQRHLPLIKTSCEQKEASWDFYAHVYDRVCILQGKPQLYGTQCEVDPKTGEYKFFPIEDEANINKRRKEMGMKPIEEYAEMMGFKYTAPAKSGK